MTDFSQQDCIIRVKGVQVDALNFHLAVRQGLTKEKVLELVKLHHMKDALYKRMRRSCKPETLRIMAAEVVEIFLEQQKLWNFPQDPNFHDWYEMPKCECPKMDNRDLKGTKYRIFSGKCPIHCQET